MSASLFVLIPPALLVIVLLLCFVGCNFQGHGIDPFSEYSTVTILPSTGLAAYWPLGEPAGSTTAVDTKGGHNGSYLSRVFPDDPANSSAAAPGTFSLGNIGIVPGDTVPPHDDPDARTTCLQTNGGYVSVPFDAAFIPTKAEGFTLEAWVHVEWSAADTAAFRVVMSTFGTTGGGQGFALLTTPDNHWAALVGNGAGLTQATGAALVFETTNHLVATYDGSDLILYVNGEQSSPTTPADYHPVTANALYIGAGRPDLPDPRFPFVGEIQCVALYKGALTLDDVIKHYHNGNGFGP
jgi:concanavalin A-like lectin/glucanase superfamily protein